MANPKLATLTDAFPGTALNTANWYVEPIAGSGGTPSGTATVAGGVLTLSQNTGYTSVNSQNSYDITGSYGFMKLIPDPNSTADQADSGFGIWNSVQAGDGEPAFSNGYEIGVQQGQLYVMAVVGDNPAPFSFSAAYNAAAMAFARIRESGGNLIFGYSADAQTWTEPGWSLAWNSNVVDATNCSVQIYAGNLGSTNAGSAGFADFNVVPAPSGSYTLFGQAVPGSVTSGAGNAGTNGVQFTVDEPCTLDGIWTYSAPALTELPVTIGLYDTASQSLVHSETASWSAGPGTGWVYAAFSSPPSLTAGTTYTAVQYRDDAVNGWFCYSGSSWANAVTSGPLTAPAASSQGWYDNTDATLHFPATQAAGNNWHLDVQVTPSTAPGTGLVQQASASTTGTTLTVTFPAAVTTGNTVILAVAGYYSGTVTGIELGGTAGTWDHVASAGGTGGNNLNLYACYGATVSSATLTVTANAPGIIGWAYEITGAVTTIDRAAGAAGTGTSWSSGTTAQTIPYPHVVIGAAAVLDSTASLTPGGTGWVNGTAYSGVGSSRPVGGVSGYQEPSGGGTYDYTGTASGTSAWGAVTAAFLAIPAPAGIQPGWGGYIFNEHSSYTGVSATFAVPRVTGGASVSVWAGLGNVYQTGLYVTYDTSSPDDTALFVWSEMLPGAGYAWDAAAYPVAVGDVLTVSVQLTATDWLLTIANATAGWTFTDVKSVLSINIGSVTPVTWPYPVGSAEVIVEDEDHANCANYGTLAFSQVVTVPAATVAPTPLITVNSAVAQYPGAFDLASGSFSMYWNSYS